MPARTRTMAVFAMPSFIAMASAVTKTDAADVAREAVRVLRHDLDRIGAVDPEYPHRRAVPTPWLCRNTMISRTTFCSARRR